jgi:hypothetical protein
MTKRKRCAACGMLTEKWQRINGGPWHCYDQCRSTTQARNYVVFDDSLIDILNKY